jgi:hypothetical protein
MMGPGVGTALLVAADDGPRETLRPLARHLGAPLTDVTAAAGTRRFWSGLLARRRPALVVVGTSNSKRGRRVESAARYAAAAGGVPVAAIEDYPGNYFDLPRCPTRLLIVESAFSARVYRARKTPPPPMRIIPPARYDHWRGRSHSTPAPRPP